MGADLHRGDRDPERAGGLAFGAVVVVAQREDLAVERREAGDLGGDLARRLGVGDRVDR